MPADAPPDYAATLAAYHRASVNIAKLIPEYSITDVAVGLYVSERERFRP